MTLDSEHRCTHFQLIDPAGNCRVFVRKGAQSNRAEVMKESGGWEGKGRRGCSRFRRRAN